jgi:hypothetical protein
MMLRQKVRQENNYEKPNRPHPKAAFITGTPLVVGGEKLAR